MDAMNPAEATDPWLMKTYRDRVAALRNQSPRTGPDEFLGETGVQAAYTGLAEHIAAVGQPGLLAARTEVSRFVADEDITYGPASVGRADRWHVDPLPIIVGTQQWTELEAGLAQRAHVLDAILTDVYAQRRFLRDDLIPPALVVGHPEFIPQADSIAVKGSRQLVLVATDVIHDASGWRVLSDRTQAPSGAGYVMGTRRIVTRTLSGLHRRSDTALLRGFFRAMTSALQDVAPTSTEYPRVVVFSPGTSSETAYDQAFTATLLGFPLVQADDLILRDGRVWVTDGDHREPVDVILRRVDTAFADPLELRSDSRLGVPGLLEASRAGTVSVVNPLGSGVLENPGLAVFLPQLAREVLGEDLLLRDPHTWWCGDKASLSHVITHLDSLIIKPVHRPHRGHDRLGWTLSAAERAQLVAQISAAPWAWVAEESLEASTSPVVTPTGLDPRRTVLRTFGVGHRDGYTFMQGGLGRVAGSAHPYVVNNAAGALAKDVWVLTDPVPDTAREASWDRTRKPAATSLLSPRVADNLFWLGRYQSRAENTARLIALCEDLDRDYAFRRGEESSQVLSVMLDVFTSLTGHPTDTLGGTRSALHDALVGPVTGGVAHSVQQLIAAAHEVRNVLSADTWSMVGRLERTLSEAAEDGEFQPHIQKLLESHLAWSGIMAESMVRDDSFGFLDAGARIERCLFTADLLVHVYSRQLPPAVEARLSEVVLHACESLITYRRRVADGHYAGRPANAVMQLLLWDDTNPRSVAALLSRLSRDLRLVADDTIADDVDTHRDRNQSRNTATVTIDEAVSALASTAVDARSWADRLTASHFTRHAPIRTQLPGWDAGWRTV